MSLHPKLDDVTQKIVERSKKSRHAYLAKIGKAAKDGPRRAHLSCGNQAHAYAAMGVDKSTLLEERAPNIGIITAYNDMLSAHQPFETYPAQIKEAARAFGATAQVAAGVPAMCDGVTQGQPGMELSLFSRDTIALAAAIGLSHNTFDAAVFLGVCDKIVPGLVIAAATFGHLPAIFLPAGPMPSGISNDEKTEVRKRFADGQCDREELMAAEMASYHGPGTCTFYGTANSNQMLMEFMGLHLPGASFVPPNSDLRNALNIQGIKQVLANTVLGETYFPTSEILNEKAWVNGIVGLMATGGSTNLVLHIPAMARAAGVILVPQDFVDISAIVPLLAKVYPNGLADVNHFHAAGGLPYLIMQLLDAGLLHEDVKTIMGPGLRHFGHQAVLADGKVGYSKAPKKSLNQKILRPVDDPFQISGGLQNLTGNLGMAVIKISAVAEDRRFIEAPAAVFHSQDAVKKAFQSDALNRDVIVVLRYQGPSANGMPELHNLTPFLAIIQDRGFKVALVTDGRMSGASGKVPAAIHLSPEAAAGGPIAQIQDGDMLRLNAVTGTLETLAENWQDRHIIHPELSVNEEGMGRELFSMFRRTAGPASQGAGVVI
ncbi:phosphogluconate dehydratase [Planktomarina sp.]|jgi:phosphogluconate dehydratase|nr:phosphogluconate dehydratase [Planktomarina sp.]